MGPWELQPFGWPEVEDADDKTECRTDGECKIGSPCRCTFPEDAEHEDCSHRWSNEAEYRLEDVKEVEALDGVNGDGEYNGYCCPDNGDDASYVVDATL